MHGCRQASLATLVSHYLLLLCADWPALSCPTHSVSCFPDSPPSISPGQDAVDALADAALAARARFEPRELAHMLWNMSRLGYVDDPFFMAFVPGAPCRG